MGWDYVKAGVDLSKHGEMHEYAVKLMNQLAEELAVEVRNLGSYASFIDVGGTSITLHVDGVGTKALVLERLGKYEVIGWDCVAMNVNDVVCEGAKPLALVDYISMPKPDVGVFTEVFNGVFKAAKRSGVVVIGGETAILPNLVNGVDAACAVLAVKKVGFSNKAREGDVIVGLESWGLHANGYSLVRKVLESRLGSYDAVVDEVDFKEELTKPTAIYSNVVLEAIENGYVNSVVHITGGAFKKVKRVLSSSLEARIEAPEPPKIFKAIMELGGVSVSEMYRVFNMGVGLLMTVGRDHVSAVSDLVGRHGFKAYILGEVVKGEGKVVIDTPFGERVEF